MKAARVLLLCLASISATLATGHAFSVTATAAAPNAPTAIPTRGVHPQDLQRYSGTQFTCTDGSQTLSIDRVNDDFCDCADGSDEPGTSACRESRFYCVNRGAAPLTLFASRVNDGICDCCDGSDEWAHNEKSKAANTEAKCPNTCRQQGAQQIRDLRHRIASIQSGLAERQRIVQESKAKLEEKRLQLENFKSKLMERQAKLEKATQVHEAEQARERAEQEEKTQLLEAQRAATHNHSDAQTNDLQQLHDANQDQATASTPSPVPQHESPASAAENQNKPLADETPAEKAFPYPQEYAYNANSAGSSSDAPAAKVVPTVGKPAAGVTQPHPTADKDSFDQPAGEDSQESFPYPAEYAYTATKSQTEDAADAHSSGDNEDHLAPEEALEIDQESESKSHTEDDDSAPEEITESESGRLIVAIRTVRDSAHIAMQQAQSAFKSCVESISSASQSVRTELQLFVAQMAESLHDDETSVPPFLARIAELFHQRTNAGTKGALAARMEFEGAQKKRDKMQSKVEEISSLLEQDYGPDEAYFAMRDVCYTLDLKQYTYEVCPFKEAKQKEKTGAATSLGRWAGLGQRAQKADAPTTTLNFEKGAHCWQGPARSATVLLLCGAAQQLTSVEEPSKCVYELTLETPLACHAEEIAQLQSRLDAETKLEQEDQEAKHSDL